MKSTDMQSALQAFLANNPDLPEGEEIQDAPVEMPRRNFRMDVILEKKGRAGKQATIVTGFQGSDDELLELASAIKRRLATGGSARGGEILIQGDRRRDVVALLTELGYKARII